MTGDEGKGIITSEAFVRDFLLMAAEKVMDVLDNGRSGGCEVFGSQRMAG
jgi:hypothetical protein